MAKAWLNDDLATPAWTDRPSQMDPVKAGLDDDWCLPCTDRHAADSPPVPGDGDNGGTTVNPILAVRSRIKQGFDDDGSPELIWVDVVKGQAITYTQRSEYDEQAGGTLVKATATMRYEGDVRVTETASVLDDSGNRWRVLAVGQIPGMLSLTLQRLDMTPLGQAGS